jgi:hypothetical protein
MKELEQPHRTEKPEAQNIQVEARSSQNEAPQSLLPKQQVDELRSRWTTIQTSFVDEPRRAVKDADALVASATKQISDSFADQRSRLEKQWSRGDEVSTEDFRLALQQYRPFFTRLLSI